MTSVIPLFRIDSLKKKITALNRRANKLAVNPITYTISEPYQLEYKDDLGFDKCIDVVDFTLENSIVSLKGYRFLAALEPGENGNHIQKIDFTFEIPEKYRTTGTWCEHCKTNRYRKMSYLVYNESTGHIAQVGSTCIKDYLGFDASVLVRHAQFINWFSLLERDPSKWGGNGMYEEPFVRLERFLVLTQKVVKCEGYVSGSKAYDEGRTSTGHAAFYIAFERKLNEYEKKMLQSEYDEAVAPAIMAWLEEKSKEEKLDDYMYNLVNIYKNNRVTRKSANWAASMYIAWLKATQEPKQKKVSDYVGEIGQKITVDAKLKYSNWIEGMYGSVCHMVFITNDKDTLITFTSSESVSKVKIGETIKLTGTVKRHEVYRDNKQTILTRTKVNQKG